MTGAPIDPGVIELAGRVFDLARGGATAELDELVRRMRAELPPGAPVVETDRWTVWTATRPC